MNNQSNLNQKTSASKPARARAGRGRKGQGLTEYAAMLAFAGIVAAMAMGMVGNQAGALSSFGNACASQLDKVSSAGASAYSGSSGSSGTSSSSGSGTSSSSGSG
ncbi:MAG TPA: hypothetical protein PL012_07715, partial [Candidatus Obscuribacter sp.]|nr:hypothetical protein [Candidatus Obscuribacter sp.]